MEKSHASRCALAVHSKSPALSFAAERATRSIDDVVRRFFLTSSRVRSASSQASRCDHALDAKSARVVDGKAVDSKFVDEEAFDSRPLSFIAPCRAIRPCARRMPRAKAGSS
jgi:hypothetical protein